MAHYVMGDIHGEADRFRAMLKKIQFSEDDILILLGDVIDRGARRNHLASGNHGDVQCNYAVGQSRIYDAAVSRSRCNRYRNSQMEQKRKCSDPCGISEAEGKGAAENYCVPAVNSDVPGYRSRWQAVLHGTWLSG